MIKYSLRCQDDHEFEGWFKDSAAFDKQAKRRDIVCPHCGDTRVVKAPMAPRISKSSGREPKGVSMETVERFHAAAAALRKEVEANCDYVGSEFAEEARRIHYGEADERGIYGEATIDEAKDLTDEGIDVLPIPSPREDA